MVKDCLGRLTMEARDASGALCGRSTIPINGWSYGQGLPCEAHALQEQLYPCSMDMTVEDDFLSLLDPNLVLLVLTYVDPVDLASLEVTSSVFRKPANLDPDKSLSFPELGAWAMCEARAMFKQMKEAEKQNLKKRCGGSWKLVLKFLKAMECLCRRETCHIAAGSGHSVIVTKSGAVYSFGANNLGQLGHSLQTDLWKPRLISSLDGVRVIQAAVGIERTMLVTDMGKVYAFGRNLFSEPESVNFPAGSIFSPELVMSLHDIFVVQIAIGYYFTAALSREGKVYTFSWGSEDKLGHATDSTDMEPRLLGGTLTDIPVLQIAAGLCHLLALAYQPNGMSIYSVGCGLGGKLGHGSTISARQPIKIEHLEQINFRPIAIAAGLLHAVALSHDGRVCTWGWGNHGCLGHGNEEIQTLPTVVAALAGVNVVRIAAGAYSTFVIADNGDVYCCGSLPSQKQEGQSFLPELVTTFRERGEHVVEISKTKSTEEEIHVLALTASGRVYAWGCGLEGQLGKQLPDDADDIPSPEVVDMDWSLN